MTAIHSPANCRFGALTIALSYPSWLETEGRPWSCVRQEPPVPLESTEVCRTCRYWEPDHAVSLAPVRP